MKNGEVYSNEGKTFQIEFSYHERDDLPTECSTLHFSLLSPQTEKYTAMSPFLLSLGLNACGSSRYLNFDYTYQGKVYPWSHNVRLPLNLEPIREALQDLKEEIPEPRETSSHVVKVEIHSNNTYNVYIDDESVVHIGNIFEDWGVFHSKSCQDLYNENINEQDS